VLIGLLAAPAPVAAQTPSFFSNVSTAYSIGVLRGKAQEFVYNPNGSTLSRLDWTFDNVAMFNTHTSVQVLSWLRAGLKSSFNLSGAASMDDYDFNVVGCPPSAGGTLCQSSHSNTALRRASLLDIYASATVLNSSGITVNALAGYKRDHFRWQAIGGTANYATLPPGVGISYEQTWSTPYVGLAAAYTSGHLTIEGRVIGSAWAQGEDQDDHHLRSLTFSESFERTRMIGAEIGLAYRFSSYLSMTADYRFQQWGTGKGPTSVVDRGTGAVTLIGGDAAGANAVSHLVSLGLKVDLQPRGEVAVSAPGGGVAGTGFQFGATSGFQMQRDRWQTDSLFAAPIATSPGVVATAGADFEDSGQRAGLFLGYGWRTSSGLRFGVEGDVGRSNISDWRHGIPATGTAATLASARDAAQVGTGWDGSLRLRAGFEVMPSLMIYGTGGVAFQEVSASLSCPATGVTWCVAPRYEEISKVKAGWTAGLGYELSFAGNWFTRGEYRYTSIGDLGHTFFANAPIDAVTARIEPANHRLTFGLGYRF
jgi:plasminogen activator